MPHRLPLQFLLLLTVAMAAEAGQLPGVFCPELSASIICDGISEVFVYSDGCRRVTCGGVGGGGVRTVENGGGAAAGACRSAVSVGERESCERHAVTVYRQLLAHLQGTKEKEEEGEKEEKEEKEEEEEEEKEKLPEESVDADGGPYECPELAASRVCRRRREFAYSDGCNRLRCHGNGLATGTRASCPVADSKDAAAVRYCRQAAERLRRKIDASDYRYECLLPYRVCDSSNKIGFEYYNGCNMCTCSGIGTAYCSRLPCHPVFVTDEEFRDICRRRGAVMSD